LYLPLFVNKDIHKFSYRTELTRSHLVSSSYNNDSNVDTAAVPGTLSALHITHNIARDDQLTTVCTRL